MSPFRQNPMRKRNGRNITKHFGPLLSSLLGDLRAHDQARRVASKIAKLPELLKRVG